MTDQSETGANMQRLPIAPRSRPEATPRYTIGDLEAETGFNARTIRFYISQGLLGPAQGRGPSATYAREHLLRLRHIKELKEQHLPLETIKARLADLSVEDLESHFAERAPSGGRWRRIVFCDDLELHVREREPRDYRFERKVDIIASYARWVLGNQEELV